MWFVNLRSQEVVALNPKIEEVTRPECLTQYIPSRSENCFVSNIYSLMIMIIINMPSCSAAYMAKMVCIFLEVHGVCTVHLEEP